MNGACGEFRGWVGRPYPPNIVDPCGNCARSYPDHDRAERPGKLTFTQEGGLKFTKATDPPPEQSKGPGDSVPSHYQGEGMQPFDVVRAFGLDYFEGNVLKYLLRWRKKNGIADLKKAAHYLACMIEQEEKDGF